MPRCYACCPTNGWVEVGQHHVAVYVAQHTVRVPVDQHYVVNQVGVCAVFVLEAAVLVVGWLGGAMHTMVGSLACIRDTRTAVYYNITCYRRWEY
jgi:hypothetical protein